MDEALNHQATLVEHATNTNALLVKVLMALNLAGILLTFFLISNLSANIEKKSGEQILATVEDIRDRFRAMRRDNLQRIDEIDSLKKRVDLNITQNDILLKADVLYLNEKDSQLFLRLLKVNMYFLATKIPGAENWFETYVGEVDAAIDRSRSRQRVLLNVKRYYQDHGLIRI